MATLRHDAFSLAFPDGRGVGLKCYISDLNSTEVTGTGCLKRIRLPATSSVLFLLRVLHHQCVNVGKQTAKLDYTSQVASALLL